MSVSVSLGKVVVDAPVNMEIHVNGVDIPFDKEVVLDQSFTISTGFSRRVPEFKSDQVDILGLPV